MALPALGYQITKLLYDKVNYQSVVPHLKNVVPPFKRWCSNSKMRLSLSVKDSHNVQEVVGPFHNAHNIISVNRAVPK